MAGDLLPQRVLQHDLHAVHWIPNGQRLPGQVRRSVNEVLQRERGFRRPEPVDEDAGGWEVLEERNGVAAPGLLAAEHDPPDAVEHLARGEGAGEVPEHGRRRVEHGHAAPAEKSCESAETVPPHIDWEEGRAVEQRAEDVHQASVGRMGGDQRQNVAPVEEQAVGVVRHVKEHVPVGLHDPLGRPVSPT